MTAPHYISGSCANCDSPDVTLKKPLFCSEFCQQAAALVRYIRGARRDGRDQLPHVRETIQMRKAMVLGGGYPEWVRTVTAAIRTEVFLRADGQCEACGRAFDMSTPPTDADLIPTIQHVEGNFSDLDNLKAFCRRCNMADAQSRFVPVEADSPQAALAAHLAARCASPEPMQLCDDDQNWSNIWRRLGSTAPPRKSLSSAALSLTTRSSRNWPGARLLAPIRGVPGLDCTVLIPAPTLDRRPVRAPTSS